MYVLKRSVATIKILLYRRLVDMNMEAPRWHLAPHANRIVSGFGFSANEWIRNFNLHVYNAVKDYNNKPHPSLHGYTPNEVYHSPILQNRVLVESIDRNVDNEFKLYPNQRFRIGDWVRYQERRRPNDKLNFWSDQVYKIINKYRFSYQLGNIDDTPTDISKYRFKHYELQLVQRATDRRDYYRAYYANRDAFNRSLRRIILRPNVSTLGPV